MNELAPKESGGALLLYQTEDGQVRLDVRLKNPPVKGSADSDYFDEMLARIRDIRAAEKVSCRKLVDIYADSIDYLKTAFAGALPEIP